MWCTLALFLTHPLALFRFCGKFLGIEYALLPNREWNQKKHKKQPWTNVECFAFGGATVRFASLETSFHAVNHTIPPPPSYKGLPLCPKDKNRLPFHGEKPLMITWFKEIVSNLLKTILHGRDAIFRVRTKWLIFNIIPHYGRTWSITSLPGLVFSPKASGLYSFGDATDLAGEVGVGDVVWLIQATASNHKPKTNKWDGSSML